MSQEDKEFLKQFHIINEADDALFDLESTRNDSELQFIEDIHRAISDFVTRQES